MHLLNQLSLGPAAVPTCEMIMDLDVDSMSATDLRQEIRNILTMNGAGACAEAVISALSEVPFGKPGLLSFSTAGMPAVGWT